MAKKIKKNNSYSYDSYTIVNKLKKETLSEKEKKNEEKYVGKQASVQKRLLSYLIDALVALPIFLIYYFTSKKIPQNNGLSFLSSPSTYIVLGVFIVSYVVFGVLPSKMGGQTIGKRLMGVRTVSLIDRKILAIDHFTREFLIKIFCFTAIIPFNLLFFIYRKVTNKDTSKTFHDALFRTAVVEVLANDEPKEETV